MATLDKVIDFSKLSEYDTKIKIHIDSVKGDKNNVAFTHNYYKDGSNNISGRSFSFADAVTGNASLTISEMSNKVRVNFQNDLGKDENGDGHIDIVTRELPTIQYVDDLVGNVSAASLSVNSLSNTGGSEVQSTIAQGDNSINISYQKNQSNELPNYIYASVNGDSFPIPTTGYVNNAIPNTATDTTSGTIKLNPGAGISLNSDGQLTISGIAGAVEGSTGVYFPNTISPASVGAGSLLITEASGTTVGPKTLSITTGTGITLKSAANEDATTFTVTGNWENHLKALAISGGAVVTRAEDTASDTVALVSVKIGSTTVTPSTRINDVSGDITITVASKLPGTGKISSIRVYPAQPAFSTVHCGQGISSASGRGCSVVVGQVCYNGANASCIVGASLFNTGNGATLLGRQHFNTKNRVLLAGTGHDTTNGPAEGLTALGQWSKISSNTLLAVGNGTSKTDRKNAFEITDDGKLVLTSPNGTRYYVYVLDGGTITTSQV